MPLKQKPNVHVLSVYRCRHTKPKMQGKWLHNLADTSQGILFGWTSKRKRISFSICLTQVQPAKVILMFPCDIHNGVYRLPPPSHVTHPQYLTALRTSTKLEKVYEQRHKASDQSWGALPPLSPLLPMPPTTSHQQWFQSQSAEAMQLTMNHSMWRLHAADISDIQWWWWWELEYGIHRGRIVVYGKVVLEWHMARSL